MTANSVTWSSVKLVATTLRYAREEKGLELIKQLADVGGELRYHANHLKSSGRNQAASQWGRGRHLHEIEELANDILYPMVTRLVETQTKIPVWSRRLSRIAGAAKILVLDVNSAVRANSSLIMTRASDSPAYLFGRIAERADALVRAACTAAYCVEAKIVADEAA